MLRLVKKEALKLKGILRVVNLNGNQKNMNAKTPYSVIKKVIKNV